VLSQITGCEEVLVWQTARDRTRAVAQVMQQGAFARDFSLARQMQRAAVSMMSRSTEGFARHGRWEFQPFLSTAKGSWGEVHSQLYVVFEVGYLVKDDFQGLLAPAEEVGRVVGGFRASVEKPRDEQRSAS